MSRFHGPLYLAHIPLLTILSCARQPRNRFENPGPYFQHTLLVTLPLAGAIYVMDAGDWIRGFVHTLGFRYIGSYLRDERCCGLGKAWRLELLGNYLEETLFDILWSAYGRISCAYSVLHRPWRRRIHNTSSDDYTRVEHFHPWEYLVKPCSQTLREHSTQLLGSLVSDLWYCLYFSGHQPSHSSACFSFLCACNLEDRIVPLWEHPSSGQKNRLPPWNSSRCRLISALRAHLTSQPASGQWKGGSLG